VLFSEILGQEHLKNHLTKSVDNGRIPHAQLFVGQEGSGTLPMAIAYAQYVLCNNKDGDNMDENNACNLKFKNLSHPDLHFAFPVTTTDKVKSKPISKFFLEEWRQLFSQHPYFSLFDWYKQLGVDNKQGQIGVDEAQEILKTLSLKAYEGGFKVMIIWMAEKMNTACANKLLKLIEEPPKKTVFILIAEDEEQIISTIRSRCQIVHFSPLSIKDIKNTLIKKHNLDETTAAKIAYKAEGNYNKACLLATQDADDLQFEKWFISWIRSAFKAKGNKNAVLDLISWSEEIAKKLLKQEEKRKSSFCTIVEIFLDKLFY